MTTAGTAGLGATMAGEAMVSGGTMTDMAAAGVAGHMGIEVMVNAVGVMGTAVGATGTAVAVGGIRGLHPGVEVAIKGGEAAPLTGAAAQGGLWSCGTFDSWKVCLGQLLKYTDCVF